MKRVIESSLLGWKYYVGTWYENFIKHIFIQSSSRQIIIHKFGLEIGICRQLFLAIREFQANLSSVSEGFCHLSSRTLHSKIQTLIIRRWSGNIRTTMIIHVLFVKLFDKIIRAYQMHKKINLTFTNLFVIGIPTHKWTNMSCGLYWIYHRSLSRCIVSEWYSLLHRLHQQKRIYMYKSMWKQNVLMRGLLLLPRTADLLRAAEVPWVLQYYWNMPAALWIYSM